MNPKSKNPSQRRAPVGTPRKKSIKPALEIEYCTGCRWLLRAGWTAQELLTTFEKELGGVTLQPGEVAGVFEVRLDGEVIHSRKADGGFIELKELKQRIRDRVAPERGLGHSDKTT